MTQMSSAV